MFAGAVNVAPVAYADAPGMNNNMVMHDQDSPGHKMPCKGMKHGCVTELGCMFLVSVLTPDLTLFTTTAWSSVIYGNASDALRGRTIEPALGPPITLA